MGKDLASLLVSLEKWKCWN